jgi:hypothetical protein
MRNRHAIWLMGVAVVVACAGIAQAAEQAKADGTWKWTVTRQGETYTQAIKLKQDGGKLTGVYVSREGKEFPIEDGKVANDKVTFTVVRELSGAKVIYRYEGKIDGDRLTGTVESDRSGDKKSRDWEASRTKG